VVNRPAEGVYSSAAGIVDMLRLPSVQCVSADCRVWTAGIFWGFQQKETGMAQVRLVNVTKVFPPDVVAVDNIQVDVADTEFIVLVGPSGCGKSTTLRMIAGLEEITRGEIYIGDRLVNDVPPKDRDIAMVFQNYALYPHMTVYNNMAFALKLRKGRKEEIRTRVHEAAEILGIEGLLDRKPKALSGGQRQRVAVGRAIVRNPKVFLFDEPLSNLDAKLRVQMRAEISRLHTKLQSTMVYVTHDQTEAMTLGDRIVVLKDGIVQQTDTPLALYNNPNNRFVAGFIGSPPMNFIVGKIVRRDGDLYFDEGSCTLRIAEAMTSSLSAYESKSVCCGIRPEDIVYTADVAEVDAGSTIGAHVEVVEPVGSEVYLYLATRYHNLVARLPADHQPRVWEKLQLAFRMEKAHFFDTDTESAIV